MITQSHTENICQAKNQLQALIPCLVSICITTDNSFADVNIPKLCKIVRKPWTNFLANPISCKGGLNSSPQLCIQNTLDNLFNFVCHSDWSCSFRTVSSENSLWEVTFLTADILGSSFYMYRFLSFNPHNSASSG